MGEELRAAHVFAALAERLPRDAIVIEEAPSNRPELLELLPALEPLGSLSPAMGGLGFGLPAAIGLRMALPGRPVVAIVGDGSSLYAIQSLWSAAHYDAGLRKNLAGMPIAEFLGELFVGQLFRRQIGGNRSNGRSTIHGESSVANSQLALFCSVPRHHYSRIV